MAEPLVSHCKSGAEDFLGEMGGWLVNKPFTEPQTSNAFLEAPRRHGPQTTGATLFGVPGLSHVWAVPAGGTYSAGPRTRTPPPRPKGPPTNSSLPKVPASGARAGHPPWV